MLLISIYITIGGVENIKKGQKSQLKKWYMFKSVYCNLLTEKHMLTVKCHVRPWFFGKTIFDTDKNSFKCLLQGQAEQTLIFRVQIKVLL